MTEVQLMNTTPNDMVKYELTKMLDKFMTTIVSELKHTNKAVSRLERRIDELENTIPHIKESIKEESRIINNCIKSNIHSVCERCDGNTETVLKSLHTCKRRNPTDTLYYKGAYIDLPKNEGAKYSFS